MITITALDTVPDFGKGLVRDLRARWGLEEAGLSYEIKLTPRDERQTPAYRARQPFGQVPVYEDEDVVLFETGSILLHIAERTGKLLPTDKAGRARARSWMFAALNSVEPYITRFMELDVFHRDSAWAQESKPIAEAALRKRLSDVAARLDGREWLDDEFTAGDLLMAAVLRIPRHSDIVKSDPVLGPYVARAEARPAFQRALASQLASFESARPVA